MGKFSMSAHLKAMKKNVEFTGNVGEVLSLHDVTVTAYHGCRVTHQLIQKLF